MDITNENEWDLNMGNMGLGLHDFLTTYPDVHWHIAKRVTVHYHIHILYMYITLFFLISHHIPHLIHQNTSRLCFIFGYPYRPLAHSEFVARERNRLVFLHSRRHEQAHADSCCTIEKAGRLPENHL